MKPAKNAKFDTIMALHRLCEDLKMFNS